MLISVFPTGSHLAQLVGIMGSDPKFLFFASGLTYIIVCCFWRRTVETILNSSMQQSHIEKNMYMYVHKNK